MTLTYRDVAEILRLVEASSCDELIVELEGSRLVVRRNGAGAGTTPKTSQAGDVAPTAGLRADPGPSGAPLPEGAVAVRAAMVGTFYRAPSPDEPPFVEVGKRIAAGDPLGLLEVMKLFTTIEAPVGGRIVDIAAGNAEAVELDQLLFLIEPDV